LRRIQVRDQRRAEGGRGGAPAAARHLIRRGDWCGTTGAATENAGACQGARGREGDQSCHHVGRFRSTTGGHHRRGGPTPASLHPLPEVLQKEETGLPCGFCTRAFYDDGRQGLLDANPDPTGEEVRGRGPATSGRCTGTRTSSSRCCVGRGQAPAESWRAAEVRAAAEPLKEA